VFHSLKSGRISNSHYIESKHEMLIVLQKNPAGSGYSKGPRKLPDPERPPQPGFIFFYVFFEIHCFYSVFVALNFMIRGPANPIFEPEKCKAYIAYTCKMCILNNKVRGLW
jgi:hypothetical protein